MTCKELTKYLSRYNPDDGVTVVVADLEKRVSYKVSGYWIIADSETPALLFETNETEPLDDME